MPHGREIPDHYTRARLRLEAAQPEAELHEAVAKAMTFLVLPPAMWTTFPAGNVALPAAAAAKLYRLGLKRGWPDVLVLHAGRIHGLELKRAGGRLSRSYTARTRRGSLVLRDGQASVFPRLQAAGMTIGVATSVDEAMSLLKAWGIPLRPTH